ncbi:MAG: metallophosphoesterase [Ignavibacteria bacterium]
MAASHLAVMAFHGIIDGNLNHALAMKTELTWLHLSDIHFRPANAWRDNAIQDRFLDYLTGELNHLGTKPDLVFCTGDIAFGEISEKESLKLQYETAGKFFTRLAQVCGCDKKRMFLVPGNHDIDRTQVEALQQSALRNWAKDCRKQHAGLDAAIERRNRTWETIIPRLDAYGTFVAEHFPHLNDPEGRHVYERTVHLSGLDVGIAGFNSAWSCAGPEDDRHLWLGAEWQFNRLAEPIQQAQVRIGLIHHPFDWFNEYEREIVEKRMTTRFDFWLHGHSHDAWVQPGVNHAIIRAGALCADTPPEFGFNLVRLDLVGVGKVHLHRFDHAEGGWKMASVAEHAPRGVWPVPLPRRIASRLADDPRSYATFPNAAAPVAAPATPPENPASPESRGIFGRDELLGRVSQDLTNATAAVIYGMRGIGKSTVIAELGRLAPLAGSDSIRLSAWPDTTASNLFRSLAHTMGATEELPDVPTVETPAATAAELQRRYPNPQPLWLWIENAQHLLHNGVWRDTALSALLLGILKAWGGRWRIVLEMRERPPPGLLGRDTVECEISGLKRESLARYLESQAPPGEAALWRYGGNDLRALHGWLGVDHGGQAHPLASRLLVQVALGRKESPLETFKRHRQEAVAEVEKGLLADLYDNVLTEGERRFLDAVALYRHALPNDHIERLERELDAAGAWQSLFRRCLLSTDARQERFYLHGFVSEWRRLQLRDTSLDDDAAGVSPLTATHSLIAKCWLDQLASRHTVTQPNIERALEALHHLAAAGESERLSEIAQELLGSNLGGVVQRLGRLSAYLQQAGEHRKNRIVLDYWSRLQPDNHRVLRFLGECWAKEESWASPRARECFARACMLDPGFPPYWADWGRASQEAGEVAIREFLDALTVAAESNPSALNDHVLTVQASCLEQLGDGEAASRLRLNRIAAGSRHVAFYNDHARWLIDQGKSGEASAVLDQAERAGCVNDFTHTVRVTALERLGNGEAASRLRRERISAGSRHAALFNDEARWLIDRGKPSEAITILDQVEQVGSATDSTLSVRAIALEQLGDGETASRLRRERISANSRNPAFYNDEARWLISQNRASEAVGILDKAEQNGCADDVTQVVRTKAIKAMGH